VSASSQTSVREARGRARQWRVRPWVHVVLHCFRVEEEHSYRETPNRLEYMAELRELLDLDQNKLPDYTALLNSGL